MSILRISTPKVEGSLQVSKQLKFPVLLASEEMHSLLLALTPLYICVVSEPTPLDQAIISKEEFFEKYSDYVLRLKEGNRVDEKPLRRYFSSAWSSDPSAFYAMEVSSTQYLIKPIKPVIQLQGHHFFYSELDRQFHPMVLSRESITWGIQFSYPQLCQDPQTSAICKVGKGEDFPNTALFTRVVQWLREHTLPTPFVVNGNRTNAPIRIGKRCLHWIDKHPQLREKRIEVFSFPVSH